MDDVELHDLLQLADADIRATSPRDFAATITAKARRRRQRRILATGLTMALAAGMVAYQLQQPSPQKVIVASSDARAGRTPVTAADAVQVKQLLAEAAGFAAEAEAHERAATALQLLQVASRKRRLAASEHPLEALDALSAAREETASLLIARGDRMLREPAGRTAGAASYRQVIELFPDTIQASAARERLKHLGRES